MKPDLRSILILGLNYAPEPVGIGPYTAAMAQSLAARGHRVRVVTAKPYYPQWKLNPEYVGGLWRSCRDAGVIITRCALFIPARPGGLKRVLHLASFALSALPVAINAAFRDRPQLVICIAPALLSVPVAWIAARLSGAKLWVHVQDFEVEAAFATGLVATGGLAARLARGFENSLLSLADHVSSISPQMCARLRAKGVRSDQITEIRNWADDRFLPDPGGGSRYRIEWALGDRKVALYSGNIANKQGIEILIEAARLLRGRKDLLFVICGEGPNRARLEELAAGMANVRLYDLQPAHRMGELLTLASVHLLPQIPGAADLVLPSKLTNMLASGRPVVATALPGTGLYDEVDGCGILTAPGDPAALAAAIAALVDDPDRSAGLGCAAAERATARWSRETIIDRLERAIESLFGQTADGSTSEGCA